MRRSAEVRNQFTIGGRDLWNRGHLSCDAPVCGRGLQQVIEGPGVTIMLIFIPYNSVFNIEEIVTSV